MNHSLQFINSTSYELFRHKVDCNDTYNLFHQGKPSPLMVDYIVDKYKVDPSRICMVKNFLQ